MKNNKVLIAAAVVTVLSVTVAIVSLIATWQVTSREDNSETQTVEVPTFEEDLSQVAENDLQNHAQNLTIDETLTLSEQENADLLYMREEEKLARDVYLTLYDKWGLQIFQNIASSEQKHTDSIKALLDAYGLADPFVDGIGNFANETLQQLYDDLVAQGSESAAAAARVGALIEDLDIVDLENAMAATDNEAIITVYQNLQNGSKNHLRSFTSTLSRYGESYEPSYLTQDEYLEIISGAMQRGNGNGSGNGGH
ncbi:DUF2202 domain-containing protein [Candidatus Dojkabacteria bacterium]|uniref:DUF2202 domain-containing protein n=1 Tax=Candidatus Dojkabacteria bacterium TaxID=2099670 RepID=A0A955I7D0_9BACT|nr:DUF2202 domain-containing protein [Candidatus Dojkabacteria bacterium]